MIKEKIKTECAGGPEGFPKQWLATIIINGVVNGCSGDTEEKAITNLIEKIKKD